MSIVIWDRQSDHNRSNDIGLVTILTRAENGVVILDMESGVRDTAIIFELKKQSGLLVEIVSYRDMIDKILELSSNANIDEEIPNVGEFNCNILIIRDIDYLRGKPITQMIIWQNVKRLSENTLVVLTGMNIKERIPNLQSALPEADYYLASINSA